MGPDPRRPGRHLSTAPAPMSARWRASGWRASAVAKLARDGRLAADWNRWRGHTYAPSTHPAGLPPANCVAAGSSAGSVHCAEAAPTITVLMVRMQTSIVALQTAAVRACVTWSRPGPAWCAMAAAAALAGAAETRARSRYTVIRRSVIRRSVQYNSIIVRNTAVLLYVQNTAVLSKLLSG